MTWKTSTNACAIGLISVGLAGCAHTGSTRAEPMPRAHAPYESAVEPAIASLSWRTIGWSVERRPIEAATIGSGPRRVLLIGGIHGDETEGLAVLPDLIDVIEHDRSLRSQWTVRVVRDMNPDGTERGSRYNARGVDLNRNWPASNFKVARRHGPAPESEPETEAVLPLLDGFRPDMIIVLHSTHRGPFVNFDGPAHELSATWVNAANRVTNQRWTVEPSMGYPTPGSLGTYAGIDQSIPILTVEFDRGTSADEFRDAAVAGFRSVLGR